MEAKQFYNAKKPLEVSERHSQVTFKVKNFNNYIKSLLLTFFCPQKAQIVDMASGMGADVAKYVHYHPKRVIFTDIATKALEECQRRWSLLPESHRYEAKFIEADFCQPWNIPSYPIAHVVICQFAMHYALNPLPPSPSPSPLHEKDINRIPQEYKKEFQQEKKDEKENRPSFQNLHVFFKTVSQMLKPNGLFWGIVADGKSVWRLLKDNTDYKNHLFSLTLLNQNNHDDDKQIQNGDNQTNCGSGIPYMMRMGEGNKDVNAVEYTTCEEDVVRTANEYGMQKILWCPLLEFSKQCESHPLREKLQKKVFKTVDQTYLDESDKQLLQIYSVFMFMKESLNDQRPYSTTHKV